MGPKQVGAGAKIGSLATGYEADISIFRRNGKESAPLLARTPDVSLVMRSGTPLYGDQNVVNDVMGNSTAAKWTFAELPTVCGKRFRFDD